MPTERIDTTKPILGYSLRQRIGAGGYGEVWSAEAPGGIAKAIKFVYGYHDEKRALTELKSLNRVRELRHPFLLSLERIEVVDGQLVVITELADESLKDLFDRHVDEGSHGIPRDQLLKYMGEAAEALDYISQEHGLQHLDVKPENLLMVSGHIKVADFGLVKELQEGNQSLMTGLTPIYAPPELFDGRPSRTSDQYSLAIVYQEMLTGQRPFSGVTAAQLASQHMNARPRLSSLPRGDQAVILRGLSKDPDLRFRSCCEMVEALVKRKANQAKGPRRPPKKLPSSPTSVLGHSTLERYITAAEARQLDPLVVDPVDASVTPTLIIGVGQSGTCVVKSLRQKLLEQIGTDEDCPSIGFLCLDTDERDLMAARSAQGGSLRVRDTLTIPLRKPEEYRNSTAHHSWLSRRWVYNVPRSLRTEGIRPLGRLAFADHHEAVFQRLHERVEEITRSELLAQTAETLGLNPVNARLRVFIVGSIAGGLGSGMMLDLAYAVRTVLLEQGIPDEDVVGILMHSAGRTATERDLTIANTCAFLSEMNHFSGLSGYPGDETCGLPPFEEDSRPFSSAYLVHLGDELTQNEFDKSIDNVAEYLFLNAVTACGRFFDECRSQEPSAGDLRTFFIRSAEVSGGEFGLTGDDLARFALQCWTADGAGSPGEYSDQAAALLQDHNLSLEGLTSLASSMLASHLQAPPDDFLATTLQQTMQQTMKEPNNCDVPSLLVWLTTRLDEAFHRTPFDGDGQIGDKPPRWAVESISQAATAASHPINLALAACVNQVGVRFHGANKLRRCLEHQLSQWQAQLRAGRKSNLTRLQDILEKFSSDADDAIMDAQSLTQLASQYAQLRLSEMILLVAVETAAEIKRQLNDQAREMATYQEAFAACQDSLGDGPLADFTHVAADHLNELLLQVDRQLETGVYARYDGLVSLLQVLNETRRTELLSMLHNAACRAVRQIRRNCDLETALCQNGIVGDAAGDWIEEHLGGAGSYLAHYGGASRLMLAVPDRSKPGKLSAWVRQRLGEVPTVIPATSGNMVVCHEVEQIPLGYMVYRFFCEHPESIEYVSRIHTRIDIDWTPLSTSVVN